MKKIATVLLMCIFIVSGGLGASSSKWDKDDPNKHIPKHDCISPAPTVPCAICGGIGGIAAQ